MKTGPVLALVLVFALLLWRLDHVSTRLSATERERDQWRATAEAYRKDAEAQAENARSCLARESEAARAETERRAIMRRASPVPPKKDVEVVDDETRRLVIDRLNRPL